VRSLIKKDPFSFSFKRNLKHFVAGSSNAIEHLLQSQICYFIFFQWKRKKIITLVRSAGYAADQMHGNIFCFLKGF
jgi:hypothetical protein